MSTRTLSRRDFLRLAGLVAAGVTVSACAPLYDRVAGGAPQLGQWPVADADSFRALSRLTFGPRASERALVAEIGLAAWIESQLDWPSIDDSATEIRLRRFDVLREDHTTLADWRPRALIAQQQGATLTRQIYSERQLYEVMVDFWTDHFNISMDKDDCAFLKPGDDRDVIRPHALGRFRDLLGASAHSPAMLFYLDNWVNVAEHPNENYARELMELHTLGVDGGYTQDDVMELARCLTGWSVKERFYRGDFVYNDDQHDTGVKRVLGREIQPAGMAEVETVLDMLVGHPSTAHYISIKLARRFIADEPPAELVARAADTFLRTDGNIRAVLRVILLDGLAGAATLPLKYKRPAHMIVGPLRMLNAHVVDPTPLIDLLGRMGQAYFRWPTPDGFPDVSGAWQGNLMPRWQFAMRLSQNLFEDISIDLPGLITAAGIKDTATGIDRMATLLLGGPIEPVVRDGLLATMRAEQVSTDELPPLVTAGLLASPAFQWR